VPALEFSESASTLSARIVAPRDGFAVVVDPWYPGWEAEVDGRPTPILRANYAFQAVAVGPGTHSIAFSYRNRGLRWGLYGALVGALALLALVRRLKASPEGRSEARS
jgi:uncharacterized membrane protein YfhO